MKIIGHLDMDAFFASVEERDKPRLRGQPLVVGADPQGGRGRGVVSTANYAARKYGIHSAMPISRAWRLAEDGRKAGGAETIWLRPDMARYGEVSGKIMDIIRKRVSLIEQTSVDEAYLDLSFTASFQAARKLAEELKRDIKEKEDLTCSIGIGPNKLLAKIASDHQKPDGLTLIRPEQAAEFLAPLSVRVLPGIGPKTEALLARRGLRAIADIRSLKEEELEKMLGKHGTDIFRMARGEDARPVAEGGEAKSVGEQHTFPKDVRDAAELTRVIAVTAENVFRNLRGSGFRNFRRVAVTVRFADFTTRTRSRTLPEPADSAETLRFEALKLFLPFLDARENPGRKAVRLLGVRAELLG